MIEINVILYELQLLDVNDVEVIKVVCDVVLVVDAVEAADVVFDVLLLVGVVAEKIY